MNERTSASVGASREAARRGTPGKLARARCLIATCRIRHSPNGVDCALYGGPGDAVAKRRHVLAEYSQERMFAAYGAVFDAVLADRSIGEPVA